MATKRTMDKTLDPPSRNPKLRTEMMVTRHKSNQMKRKLRDKDRSMKRITQLLQSPPKTKHANPNKLSPTSKLSAYLAKTVLDFSKSPSSSPKQNVTFSPKTSKGTLSNQKSILIKTAKKSNIIKNPMKTNMESAKPDYVKVYTGKSLLKSNNIPQESNIESKKVIDNVAITRNVLTNTCKSFTKTSPKKSMRKIVSVKSKYIQKDAENNNNNNNKEYYPDKLRRTGNVKKIVLKPKNEWKVIGGLNKRKRYYPLKDSKMPTKHPKVETDTIEPSADLSELSVEELIQLSEETDNLTDEDLMEILTCPSPVWWESQDDCKFLEDPIIKVSQTRNDKAAKSDSPLVPEMAVDKCDDKFLKKRSSLENVLLFIKTKVLIDNQTEVAEKINKKGDTDQIDVRSCLKKKVRKAGRYKSLVKKNEEENALKILESMHIPVESSAKTSKVINDDPIILDEDSDSESGQNNPESNKEFNKSKKDDTEGNDKETNDNISEIDISTTLPPLKYFPKAVDSPKSSLDISEADDVIDSSSVISNQGLSDTISDTNVRFMEELSSNESDIHEKQPTVVNQVKQIETAKKVKEDLRRIYLKLTQKETEKIEAADKIADQQPAIDCNKIICERFVRSDESESPKQQDDEYVVVYKIIDSDNNVTLDINKESCSKDFAVAKPDTEIMQKHILPQKKIDEFNKKVKKVTRKEKSTIKSTIKNRDASLLKINKMSDQKHQNGVKTNEKENKTNFCKSCIDKTKISIRISNNEIIHYCSKCSSIFETTQCMFCLRKSSVESDSAKFMCKLCNTRCCCSINLKAHLKKHISMSNQDS